MDEDGPDAPNKTKRLDTEIHAETGWANSSEAITEESFLHLSPDWDLWERISKEDLDDRTKWSEPINADPMAYFIQALNR
jgi:hypothetical protein